MQMSGTNNFPLLNEKLQLLRKDVLLSDYKTKYNEPIYDRITNEIRQCIVDETNWIVTILKTVSVFHGLSHENLITIAQSMDEVNYMKDDDIVRQDDTADSFYILQEGTVVVKKYIDHDNDKILAHLSRNAYFGELALMTRELRSATITVTSPTAKCMRMKRVNFEEVTLINRKIVEQSHMLIGRDVVNTVTIFNKLSATNKKQLVAALQPINFLPGTYICRQDTIGNTFYIIAQGSCRVTINHEVLVEKEVSLLTAGDFFGEVALIDKSNKRSANVIAIDNVVCMSLNRLDFDTLLKSVRISMLEYSSTLSSNKKNNKNKHNHTSSSGGNSSSSSNNKSKGNDDRSSMGDGHKRIRRICGFDNNGIRSEPRVQNILKRFGTFISEALWNSLYSRLFCEYTINSSKLMEYGDLVADIAARDLNRADAVNIIRDEMFRILSIDINKRTSADHGLVYSIMNQRSKFKDNLCDELPVYKFSELSKKVRIVRVKPLKKIFDIDSVSTCFYVVLRGSVRVFNNQQQHIMKDNGNASHTPLHRNRLIYQEDLRPGDYFGEDVLLGMNTRVISAQAITTVDLILIEASDFSLLSDDTGTIKMTIEEKFAFLNGVPIVRDWEPYRKYRLAYALEQVDYDKGASVVKIGEVSKKLCFLNHGRIDWVESLYSKKAHAIACVQQYEYFGESGIISKYKAMNASTSATNAVATATAVAPVGSKNAKKSKVKDAATIEEYYALCKTKCELLCLSEDNYHLLDNEIISQIATTYQKKLKWRSQRADHIRLERIKFRKHQKELGNSSSQLPRSTSIHDSNSDDIISTTTDGDCDDDIMEDIPVILNSGYDPFMVFPTCKSTRDVERLQVVLGNTRRPKSARLRARCADQFKEVGFVGTTTTAKNYNNSDGTLHGSSTATGTVGMKYASSSRCVTQHSVSSSASLPVVPNVTFVGTTANSNSSSSSSTFNYQSEQAFSLLKGSMRIPSARSYREACITQEEANYFATSINSNSNTSRVRPKTASSIDTSNRNKYT